MLVNESPGDNAKIEFNVLECKWENHWELIQDGLKQIGSLR